MHVANRNGQMAQLESPPNLFDFDDYRIFLRRFYEYRKHLNPKYSFRYFSARIGYRSPCFMQLVISGRRNLTADGVARFTKALKLNYHEASYFRSLVGFNQASSSEDRQRYAQEIMRSKGFQLHRPLDAAKFKYWSRWYYVAVAEMALLEGFQEDPKWIAKVLTPTISPEQAKEALEQLETLGILRRSPEGKLQYAQADITTGDQVVTAAVSQFHREMIQRGREAIDRFRRDNRQISAVTFCLSPNGEKRVRELIDVFRKELIAIAKTDSDCRRVFQVNFQAFPLSEEVKP